MRHFLIGFPVLIVAYAIAFQPSGAQVWPLGAEVERVILGDDDLPDGAPILTAAAQVKRVCYVGPANPTPNCIFDTIAECRAACRTKRLHGPRLSAGKRGWVQCMMNPALQQPRRPLAGAIIMGR